MTKKYIALLIMICNYTAPIFSLHHNTRSLTSDSASKSAAAENADHLAAMSDGKERKTQAPAEETPLAGQRQVESKEASAKAERAQLDEKGILHLPPELGGDEQIDLTQKDTVSQSTFAELIKERHELGEPFLLARILTQDIKTGRFNRSYYEAHGLNRILFGNYPITATHNHRALYNFSAARTEYGAHLNRPYLNPLDGLPITNGIDYLTTDPQNPAAGFTYFCSHHQLLSDDQNDMQALKKFHAHQQEDLELKAHAVQELVAIGMKHFHAQEYQVALKYLKPVAQQSLNSKAQLEALQALGFIYYHSADDAERNEDLTLKTKAFQELVAVGMKHFYAEQYSEAIKHLKLGAQQSINPEARFEALRALGLIYYRGGDGIERNFIKAVACLEPLTQSADQTTKLTACRVLGLIYYRGGCGIKKDFATAMIYLEPLRQQSIDKDAQLMALKFLALICYYGDDNIRQDFNTVITYLTPVAAQTLYPEVRADALKILGLIYYHGNADMEPDFGKAAHYLEILTQQSTNQDLRLMALRYLSLIYFHGGHGIEKNFTLASAFLEQLSKRISVSIDPAEILTLLSTIYFEGGHGVQQDFKAAIAYLEELIQQSTDPDAQNNARNFMKKIKEKIDEQSSCIIC